MLLIMMSFVPLCAMSLSLLEGGANGIDDTATQFAEVCVVLQDFLLRMSGLNLLSEKEDSHVVFYCCVATIFFYPCSHHLLVMFCLLNLCPSAILLSL